MNKFLLSLCFVLTLSSGLMAMDATDQNPEELIHQFSNAIGDGDYPKVEALLRSGALANTRCWTGETILHRSALLGKKKICELLLASNAQVDAKDGTGLTPLFCAVIRGHKNVFELLLNHNAQVDLRCNRKYTPLRWASIQGHHEIATYLIDVMICKQAEFQKSKKAIVTFLGIRKKSGIMRPIDRYVIQCIARIGFDIAKSDNVHPVEQINEIGNLETRADLMDYYRKNLNSDPKIQSQVSHE